MCGGNDLTKILGAGGPVNVNWSPHDQNYEPQLSTSLSLTSLTVKLCVKTMVGYKK